MKAQTITLLLLLSLLSTGQASDLGYPNKYSGIAESIFDMMDAFSSAYSKRQTREPDYGYPNIQGTLPGITPPLYSGQPNTPPYSQANAIGQRLTGSWQGTNGEILVIRNGRFRLYMDRTRFRDGRIILHNERVFSLLDPRTKRSQKYEYAENQGQLALRDAWGRLHLYKRVAF